MAGLLDQLQEGSSTTYFEGRYRCKDGSWRWLGWTAAPFVSEELIYIFARDITTRKQAENEIRQLNFKLQQQVSTLTEVNKEMETFNYSIAHDLRAPLRSMQGFAQILLHDHGPRLGADGQELAGRIVRSSQHLDRLLADLLAYSRLTSTELPRIGVNLDEILSEVLTSLHKDTQDKAAVLEVEGPLGSVIGHGPTINQILANLVCNSLKFVGDGQTPRIRISASRQENMVCLSVQDNGIGIEPEHHGRIFGLFERLHSTREYPGTGIGLALVRKAVERMGGHVGLESSPGKGSTFRIELPASPSNANLPQSG
jgi:signal transduction histidine kinase